ncbi:MAG: hypothetical protein H7X80_00655, partial [bacterium]|nr:hypothetical protein [Candidatus Kapabacteria bacterium]
PAYSVIAHAIKPLVALGFGRWGDGDLVLGIVGQLIDLGAPMEPVVAYGEIAFGDASTLSISVHRADDEGRVEIHFSGMTFDEYQLAEETDRWCFSYWSPGQPSPANGLPVRDVTLDTAGTLTLALDATRRLLWLFDGATRGNTLIPVTNFYNELMLSKNVRDPEIALNHRRLFDAPDENSDEEIARGFKRYNMTWRKVDAERLEDAPSTNAATNGFVARIARAFRGGESR